MESIPLFIFPMKFEYMLSYEDIGMNIYSYQATTHNYVEIILNFGLVGSIILAFLCGIILNILKSKPFLKCIYIPICCNLPFFFFRSFNDTIIKHIIAYSIIFPIILIFITQFHRKYKKNGFINHHSMLQRGKNNIEYNRSSK